MTQARPLNVRSGYGRFHGPVWLLSFIFGHPVQVLHRPCPPPAARFADCVLFVIVVVCMAH